MAEKSPSFERQLQKIDKELGEIDKQLSGLQIRRRELLETKESLKNKQIQKKSLELSSLNWEKGKLSRNVLSSKISSNRFFPIK